MNNWVDRFHIIRRVLVFAITAVFLKVTLGIFDGTVLDAFRVTAYGLLCGLEGLIIKFYLNSRTEEDRK